MTPELDTSLIILGFRQPLLENLIATLEGEGYQPYLTAVGGSGLGILPPHRRHQVQPSSNAQPGEPITPPDTPAADSGDESPDTRPLKTDFAAAEKLTEWAEGKGKWLFV